MLRTIGSIFLNKFNERNTQHVIRTEEKQEEKKIDFTNMLPQEIILEIFSYLNPEDLVRSQKVNRTYRKLASDKSLWDALILKMAFGKKQWKTHFGDIGIEPLLPKDIFQELKKPCPFFPKRKIEDTHMLVVIPATIDGKPFNLNTLKEIVQSSKKIHKTVCQSIHYMVLNEHSGKSVDKSYWVLMTNVIEESRNQNYIQQQALITKVVKQTGINYEVTNLVVASTCIVIHYVSTGKDLLNTRQITYTRCQEKTQNSQIAVGSFTSDSKFELFVNLGHSDTHKLGVTAMRKLV